MTHPLDVPMDDKWMELGKRCSAGRRSLWWKLTPKPEAVRSNPECGLDEWCIATPENVECFELRAGREGDDAYVRIGHDNPQFAELLDVMLTAQFAAET